eukprot:2558246-Prymnesium_polylepis.1
MPLQHLKPEYQPDLHPFFFHKTADGQVTHVLHHPDEHAITIRVKKHMAAMLQFREAPLGYSAGYEQDARGNASAQYHIRRGVLGRLVYRKKLDWAPTKVDMLRHSASVHAIMDGRSRVLRKLHMQHTSLLHKHDIEAEFAGSGIGDTRRVNPEGLDGIFPKEPQISTFTLKPRSAAFASKKSRELTEDEDEDEDEEEWDEDDDDGELEETK